ncbi:cell surface glycoprotein MUC18-like isoform X5 [Mobula hypostoma]|uniref:cell surface glycoprotein MUC18-like isoform X5 n=1 Tax=Mobula hypostoma TaxID=723540 RepID=UPI002FC31662
MATSPAVICGLLVSVYVHFAPAQDQSASASLRLLSEVGKELQLSCDVPHENNTLTIRWLQKTRSMNEWEEIAGLPGDEAPVNQERFKVLENGSLVITSVRVKDEGQFKCHVGKSGSEDHSIINVAVFKIPTKPVLDVGYLTFTAGELSEIGTCISRNGYPVNNITWYKNGRQVVANGKDAIEKVVIEVEPSTHINEGESVRLKCIADANPLPEEYTWHKDGKYINTSEQYTIQFVTKSDEGDYQCTVFDFNFMMKSAVKMIYVEAKENNEVWSGKTGFLKGETTKNRAGMVIGIIVTLALVIFFLSVAYYFCYYRKKEEKKPLEDVEERPVMDPEKDSATEEKVEQEPVLAK